MQTNLKLVIEQFIDLLLPELTPYEATMYLFLLRNSRIKKDTSDIRIGKRTISDNWAQNSRGGGRISYAHVSETLKGLEEKGCIKIGDTNREGTLYSLLLPEDIASVKEKLSFKAEPEDEDYFNNSECKVAGNSDPLVAANFDPPKSNRYPVWNTALSSKQEGGHDERQTDQRSPHDAAGRPAHPRHLPEGRRIA